MPRTSDGPVCAKDIAQSFLPKPLRPKMLAKLLAIQVRRRKGRGSPLSERVLAGIRPPSGRSEDHFGPSGVDHVGDFACYACGTSCGGHLQHRRRNAGEMKPFPLSRYHFGAGNNLEDSIPRTSARCPCGFEQPFPPDSRRFHFCERRLGHVGAGVGGPSREIRRRMVLNSRCGIATSAI